MEAPELTRLIRTAAGVPDLQPRIHRSARSSSPLRSPNGFGAGRAFLIGDAAHRVTPRRHRHEHGDRRRVRPRLEAQLGAEGLGRRGAARHLRGRAPPGGRPQRRALGRRAEVRTATRSTRSTSTSGVGSRTSGSRRSAGVSRRSTSSATGSHCSRATARPASKLLPLSTAPRRSRFGSSRR